MMTKVEKRKITPSVLIILATSNKDRTKRYTGRKIAQRVTSCSGIGVCLANRLMGGRYGGDSGGGALVPYE